MSFPRSFPSARFLAGCLAVAAALAAASAQTIPMQHEPRPIVLMLHGRGVDNADSTYLRRAWLDALNQGLVGVGGTALLGADDFRLIWYADALDPRAPSSCRGATSAASQGVAAVLATAGTLMGVAADLVGDQEAAALRQLAGDMLYLGDEGKRCVAEERLVDALASARVQNRPVVLIAHSFGSLLAYHHLERRDSVGAPPVQRLVTIGSLIGRPELRELLLGANGRRTELPAGVGSWVNVRDPNDLFAAPLTGLGSDSAHVLDRTTERPSGPDPHDAARYLTDPATARAVLESWCAALPGASETGPVCRRGP
jgi:hypothetical protein